MLQINSNEPTSEYEESLHIHKLIYFVYIYFVHMSDKICQGNFKSLYII